MELLNQFPRIESAKTVPDAGYVNMIPKVTTVNEPLRFHPQRVFGTQGLLEHHPLHASWLCCFMLTKR
jgi:hypothetical protein